MIRSDFGLNFDQIRIKVASPKNIESWSFGEVLKPETINYRTQKPERDGLFDEKIFGPTKDFECYCGKYKKIRYKGVICDKCGVEVTRSSVRRERMGHISLAVPIAHIWYIRGVPSVIGTLLNLTVNNLEKIVYFAGYIVTELNDQIIVNTLNQLDEEYKNEKKKKNIDKVIIDRQYRQTKQALTSLAPKMILTEEQYHELSLKFGNVVSVGIGAEAIHKLLQNMNLDDEIKKLEEQVPKIPPSGQRKALKRLQILKEMKAAGIRPEHLVLTKLPVMPPDLRPMVQLDGGRFAASDLNDLYRRVLNRNNRLKKLLALGSPEVITRNEKRMLQEAVDALIDNNARRGKTPQTAGAGMRKLRSLSDMLRGKQGRFRQNLLGKRVDYSGRSVIVVGPELKLNQCGLPKTIALELYKPFVMSRLIEEGFVHNIKNASKLVEKGAPEVWEILERITSKSLVLLNRAPTLHRLGIQAFQPILIEGKAIRIHPLVCYAYNADFDGDQMAVHLPLSAPSKIEAEEIMSSVQNLLKPASGDPVIHARYDIVYGIYYLTKISDPEEKKLKTFSGKNEAILAYQMGKVKAKQKILVRLKDGTLIETSAGRILFNNIIPNPMRFINRTMDNSRLKKLVADIYENYGKETTVQVMDDLKDLGFEWSGKSGLTIAIDDLQTPSNKRKLVSAGEKKVAEVENQYRRGLITQEEKEFKMVEIWTEVKSKIEEEMVKSFDRDSSIYEMVESGARGSFAQILQMSGMKGLVVAPTGEIIPLPVKSNFKEGLDVYEYFISTHGARKGKSDTSLRTSDAGYLTRRLVDVSQDIVVSEQDCGTSQTITINRQECEAVDADFSRNLYGRTAGTHIIDPKTGKVLVKKNTVIGKSQAQQIKDTALEEVAVRSPIYCAAKWGLCQKCYGNDLASGELAKLGDSVGITAAQAIGEPGTQLTMTTFHLGGVHGADITTGLPRVEEIFEARRPKRPALISPINGVIKITEKAESYDIFILSDLNRQLEYQLSDYKALVKTGQKVSNRQTLAVSKNKKTIRAPFAGKVVLQGARLKIISEEKESINFYAPLNAHLLVKDGQRVAVGDLITDDYIDFETSLKYRGIEQTINYILSEVQKIYASQGQTINNKHLEVIIRQMFSKVLIDSSNNYNYIPGQIIDRRELESILAQDKSLKIKFSPIVMGITRVALKTASFLSAASFQQTTHSLISAAIRGAVDPLQGLKENVIIGRLIPAGTGFRKRDAIT